MRHIVVLGLLLGGVGLAIVGAASLALQNFVGQEMRPEPRAALIAGLAYLIATLFMYFGGAEDSAAFAPLAALPGALIVFLFWRMVFSKAWEEEGGPSA